MPKTNTKTKKKDETSTKGDGSLIIVEGVDGSGKSTQLQLLAHWLSSNGFAVEITEWNSSFNIRPLNKYIKKNKIKYKKASKEQLKKLMEFSHGIRNQ